MDDATNREAERQELFHELTNALLRLRRVFVKYRLDPPVAVELKTHEDGNRLRACLPHNMVHAIPRMGSADDRPDIVFNLVGIEVRYPASFRAREHGGFDIE